MDEKKMKNKYNEKAKKVLLGILVIIMCTALGAGAMYGLISLFPDLAPTVNNISKLEKEVTVNENGIADAVDKVYDAVVVVETFSNGNLIASGTGFVFRMNNKNAYIMTNHHVIEDGDEIRVVFTNGDEIKTEVKGSDSYADIAILAVDADDNIAVAELGSSTDARVGDTVFAIGAPLDSAYSWSVTRGIVSGKDRLVEVSSSSISSGDWLMKVLQTDAAINSGNSGGPLCNSNGEVIGIASMKLVSSGVEGMGFAIPIEDALEYAEIIISGESISRPYLGVSMVTVDDISYLFYQGISISNKLEYGVVLVSVEKNSPADKVGLTKGDVIVEIGGEKVTSIASFKYNLYTHDVGETVKIKYFRGEELKETEVKLVASE